MHFLHRYGGQTVLPGLIKSIAPAGRHEDVCPTDALTVEQWHFHHCAKGYSELFDSYALVSGLGSKKKNDNFCVSIFFILNFC